jgi:WD40 repeat protein
MEEITMVAQTKSIATLALCLLALLLAAPLRAAPPAPAPHPTMVLQVGHTGPINAFAYSRDGQILATGGYDGVRLWDTASGQLKAILPAGYVFTLAFAPDGKTLATDGGELWDVASGQLKATLMNAVR